MIQQKVNPLALRELQEMNLEAQKRLDMIKSETISRKEEAYRFLREAHKRYLDRFCSEVGDV